MSTKPERVKHFFQEHRPGFILAASTTATAGLFFLATRFGFIEINPAEEKAANEPNRQPGLPTENTGSENSVRPLPVFFPESSELNSEPVTLDSLIIIPPADQSTEAEKAPSKPAVTAETTPLPVTTQTRNIEKPLVSPGLYPYTYNDENVPFTLASFQERMAWFWANPDQQNLDLMGQIISGNPTFGDARYQTLDINRVGMGHTPEIVDQSDEQTEYAKSLYVITNNRGVEFLSDPRDNPDLYRNLFTKVGKIAGSELISHSVEETFVQDYLQILATLQVNGQWDQMTLNERGEYAQQGIDGHYALHFDGADTAAETVFSYRDGSGLHPLFSVRLGNRILQTREIHAGGNVDARAEQPLSDQCAQVREQDDGTNIENAAFTQLSPDGLNGSFMTLDLDELEKVNYPSSLIHQASAHEFILFSDGFNGKASPEDIQAKNLIPNGEYPDIGGQAFGVISFQEGDEGRLLRRGCLPGKSKPTSVTPQPQPVTPEQPPFIPPPPPENPECEKDCGPQEKSPPGDQTNPDGETEPDPGGGQVIIDGKIDTDGDGIGDKDDDIGSGR